MSAQWKPIPGHPRQLVSDQGEVLGTDGRLRRPFYITGHLYLWMDGTRKPVHHLVLEAFVGPRPEGTEALHANDVGDDNRLVNLRWGTHSENVLDSVRNGTHNQVAKTQCVNGHEFTPENTQQGKSKGRTYRRCRACHNADNRARRQKVVTS